LLVTTLVTEPMCHPSFRSPDHLPTLSLWIPVYCLYSEQLN